MPSVPPVLPHLPVSSAGMRVPYNDLHAQYLTIKAEIDDAIARTVRDSAFIRGPEANDESERTPKLIQHQCCPHPQGDSPRITDNRDSSTTETAIPWRKG